MKHQIASIGTDFGIRHRLQNFKVQGSSQTNRPHKRSKFGCSDLKMQWSKLFANPCVSVSFGNVRQAQFIGRFPRYTAANQGPIA